MQNSQAIMQKANLVAQKVQARAQYETLEQREKADLQMLQYLVYLVMKSKKSDQLTKQFNDAASLKRQMEQRVQSWYDTAVAAGEISQINKTEFIQLNGLVLMNWINQMMGVRPSTA
jgi:hypothetical protein